MPPFGGGPLPAFALLLCFPPPPPADCLPAADFEPGAGADASPEDAADALVLRTAGAVFTRCSPAGAVAAVASPGASAAIAASDMAAGTMSPSTAAAGSTVASAAAAVAAATAAVLTAALLLTAAVLLTAAAPPPVGPSPVGRCRVGCLPPAAAAPSGGPSAGRLRPKMDAMLGWLRSLKRFMRREDRAHGGAAGVSSRSFSSREQHQISYFDALCV